MERVRIQHSNLRDGELEIQGYKHAMVQIISASIALDIPVVIMNAPLVDDTFVMQEIIEKSGGSCKIDGHRVYLDPRGMTNSNIDSELSKKIHGSLYLMPAFAVRFGQVRFYEAGGCQIGSSENKGKRPIEHMLDVMKQFGIETEHESGAIVGKKASNIESVKIDIMVYSESKEKSTAPMISGATKTALLCSTFVKHTKIFHPYLKTDVQDLVRFMRQCGYKISISKESIEVSAPTTKPHNQYVEFYLTECVSEIMTYLALAVHTNISLTLKIANIELIKKGLELEFNLLKQMGVALLIEEANAIIIGKKHTIQSINIDVTNDSIQSDHHPFFTLMLLKGNKQARIREFVWKDRFAYAHELKKLGADLTQEANALYIRPSALLKGNQTLNASDTRAAAILILASLTAEEPVEIENIQHLHRGYENLLGSIQLLGADVIREVAVV